MPISFSQIPSNIKVPLYWVEVDPSKAGLPTLNLRALIVGAMTASYQKVSTAAVMAGQAGTGYLVGDTINMGNGVSLAVATVTTGAVATVTVANGGAIAIGATPPANPVSQFSSSGSGTGAKFNLTWTNQITPFAGTAIPNVPIPIGTQAQADDKFGEGSELALMFHSYFANNFANEVWAAPVIPSANSAKATGTITVTAPPTEAGTIHLYIGGHHVPINVGSTDTANDVAAEIVSQIMDDVNQPLPVTATAVAAAVTLTATFAGVNGNDIRVELDYYGKSGGDYPVMGIGLTLPATGFLTGGVGTPNFDALITALGEQDFEYICVPYTDSNTLLAWEEEMGFGDTGRWGWQRQLFGHVFCAKRGLYDELVTFGLTRNSGVVSVMAFENTTPTPMFEMAAAYTAKAQRALSNDPARPLQTLSLQGTLPAKLHERFNFIELNSLASSGLAIQKCWEGSQTSQIAREQTTYQLNLYGQGDDAYELVTTLATLAKVLRNQRHAITSKYPRHKLANDGTRFGPGQAMVTPGVIKAELIAQYRQDEWSGLVEDTRNFKRHLLVERDPDNPNRLNVLYPPDLINQLRVFAVLAQFRLQYDRGIDTGIIGAGVSLGSGGAVLSS